jgi:hypothetical protein
MKFCYILSGRVSQHELSQYCYASHFRLTDSGNSLSITFFLRAKHQIMHLHRTDSVIALLKIILLLGEWTGKYGINIRQSSSSSSSSSSCSWRFRHVFCSLILKMKLVPPSLPRSSHVPSFLRSILWCLFWYPICVHPLHVLQPLFMLFLFCFLYYVLCSHFPLIHWLFFISFCYSK